MESRQNRIFSDDSEVGVGNSTYAESGDQGMSGENLGPFPSTTKFSTARKPLADCFKNRTVENTAQKEVMMEVDEQDEHDPRVHTCGSGIYHYEDVILGHGATATVYEGYFENKDRPAAVKKLVVPKSKELETELKVLRMADSHVNVVRYFASRSYTTYSYIAMELASCSLQKYVDKQKKTGFNDHSVETIKGFCRDACDGLQWLHGKNIIHRDLKPANILIFEYNDPKIAKLADFGSSRISSSLTEGTNSLGKGTCDWMSPEGLKAFHNQQTFKTTQWVDIFSLGMTMFYALSGGVHPFGGQIDRYRFIITSPPQWQFISEDEVALKNLLLPMMNKVPEFRPKASCILEHPYFWDAKRTLHFIGEVSNALNLNQKTGNWKGDIKVELTEIRNKIDKRYHSFIGDERTENFNWKDKLCDNVKQWMTEEKKNKKTYNEKSAMKLVEFIRDKKQHSAEWSDTLKSEHVFGRTDEQYITYFTDRFPALISILYAQLQFVNTETLANLKSTFYKMNEKRSFPLPEPEMFSQKVSRSFSATNNGNGSAPK